MIGSIGTSAIGMQATRSRQSTASPSGSSDFLALAAETPTAQQPSRATEASAPATRATTDGSDRLKEALAAFKKEASLTPAERARRDVLESMNLTEDAIAAMTPEQRAAAEEKIAMEVARRMRAAEMAG